VLRGAYGVKGWSRVQPYSDRADALRASRNWWLLDAPAVRLEVTGVRRHGTALVAKWRGCDTPEDADRRRGLPVGVPRAEFPPLDEGEAYWVDLIGARVVNRSGIELGTVTALLSSGAQDLLQVRRGEKVLLVPMVERHVDQVNLAGREIRVDWELEW
jgi:16S rRNA processing protein RimM